MKMNMDRVQILHYIGSKARMAGALSRLIPQDSKVYVEPFCGSAALALNSRKFDLKVLNDWNPHIANFWKVATDPRTSGGLHKAIKPITCDWRDFQDAKDRREAHGSNQPNPVQWAADTFFLNRNSFNAQGDYWVYREIANLETAQFELAAGFKTLEGQRFEVYNRNSLLLLTEKGYLDNPEAFIYLDPPYIEGLRCDGKLYEVDMPDERDHINLLKAIHGAKAKVILSGYWSGRDDGKDLYDFHLSGWRREFLGEYTKGCEGGKDGKGRSKGNEWIWMNYDPLQKKSLP